MPTSTRALTAFVNILVVAVLVGACGPSSTEDGTADRDATWWRGNMHTHSLWSDGDDFPEMVTRWYKEEGYDFLMWSDHNAIQNDGDRWIAPAHDSHAQRGGGLDVYEHYRETFGDDWVETKERGDTLFVRLKQFEEYRERFEEPGGFLLVRGEEITDEKVVHVNATNVEHRIPPQDGETVRDVIQRNVEAVLEQRRETGRPMFPHLNHPNFHYAVTAEDLAEVEELQFFEVFNGHRGVNNYGEDAPHVSLDRLWDITLTLRLLRGNDLLYGLAVDDAHHYEHSREDVAQPGRGWVMVRAAELTPESIIASMEAGDFYATTGVDFEEIQHEDNRLSVVVDTEPDVDYTIQFIGTPATVDTTSRPVTGEDGEPLRTTRRYTDEIGAVLKEVEGPEAHYDLTGDELYVRAKIISSKPHPNPFAEGDPEVAWTQPVRP